MKDPEDMEEFGGHKDPGEYPTRDGILVLPGDETETCNTCLWVDCIPKSDDAGCFVKWKPGCVKALVEYFPVEPDKRACPEWRQHPVTTFRQRLMIRRTERRLKARGEYHDLTAQQRRDDAEESRQYRKRFR